MFNEKTIVSNKLSFRHDHVDQRIKDFFRQITRRFLFRIYFTEIKE